MTSIFSKQTPVVMKDEVEQASEETLEAKIRKGFDAAYYLSKYHDVRASGVDPLEHYMAYGWREKRRPNGWFNPDEYTARHPELVGPDTNPFLHFLTHQSRAASEIREDLRALRENQVLYWADKYLDGEDGPRPVIIASAMPDRESLRLVQEHFDAEFYIAQNPEVMERSMDPLLHFMTQGWLELRDPSPDFSVSYYLRNNADIRRQRVNPYVHFLKHGSRERWRRSATVADANVLELFENDETMSQLVARAKQLEPMVAMPNTPRQITSPLKAAEHTTNVAQALRRKLAGKTYRYIVAVPHVRMSGASRVASIFADALTHACEASDILVVTTDGSENEYIGWFSEKLDIFDLSKEIGPLSAEEKIRALIDVMRGVGCRTIVNVNSRLVWEAMRLYGRQLHHEFRVVTYLFTWDENTKGDRVGYPIQWLRDTADHHHLILTDTMNLANDVADRFGFDQSSDHAQVVPLYTPMTGETATATRETRRSGGGHFLWAGRFDPQKRLDILVAIARANPDMTFDVYGKTVLGNKSLSDYNPPDNIIPKGTYTDLQDVLNTRYSGFLYTSQWDGLPTILLDMAAAGLPIVAPDVGGIAELLDDQTGWLVEDFEDVEGFSAALAEMAANPKVATARAQALQARLADKFAPERYINRISKMVTTYDL
ncbi:glycosyltransferase family 4 protein [Meridianimarinicoccus sp. MJW13]|uniref:glycosyltransferase family 4 protein n=1 Tax=Meridianimarinicoccus sp. MJW13 TaxID=2720031 RepID=UPI0018686A86|nr:glycosyltransferase family 4 protein [Fluviibacterium sp. MJW13]